MANKILVLPGDGIGPEIVAEAIKVLTALQEHYGLKIELEHALVGGCAYDTFKTPLPEQTLALAKESDSILLGAVGSPKYETLDISVRPEKGLLGLRSELALFSNLRPAILYPQLVQASSLRPEIVSGLNSGDQVIILVVFNEKYIYRLDMIGKIQINGKHIFLQLRSGPRYGMTIIEAIAK